MAILSPDVRLQLAKYFSDKMHKNVNLVLRCEEGEKCTVLEQLLNEISEVNDHISVNVERLSGESGELLPHIVMKNEDTEFHFYGIPAYYEFNTLIRAITYLGGSPETVSDTLLKTLEECFGQDGGVKMEVFVTQACPYCSEMALSAYRLTLATGGKVEGVVIDVGEFQEEFADREIEAVPTFYIKKGDKEIRGVGLLSDDQLAFHIKENCTG